MFLKKCLAMLFGIAVVNALSLNFGARPLSEIESQMASGGFGGTGCYWDGTIPCGAPPADCSSKLCNLVVGQFLCPGGVVKGGFDIPPIVAEKNVCDGVTMGLTECAPGAPTSCGVTVHTCRQGNFCQLNAFGSMVCTSAASTPEVHSQSYASGDYCGIA